MRRDDCIYPVVGWVFANIDTVISLSILLCNIAKHVSGPWGILHPLMWDRLRIVFSQLNKEKVVEYQVWAKVPRAWYVLLGLRERNCLKMSGLVSKKMSGYITELENSSGDAKSVIPQMPISLLHCQWQKIWQSGRDRRKFLAETHLSDP